VNPTIAVTTTADVINGSDGVLSLREAVIEANADAGADTIELATSATYELASCSGPLPESDPAIGDVDVSDVAGLTVQGRGATIRPTSICAGGTTNLLDNVGGGSLSIDHVTLGDSTLETSPGGAVRSNGPTTIDHVTLTNFHGDAVNVVGEVTATSVSIDRCNVGVIATGAVVADQLTVAATGLGIGSDTSVELTDGDIHGGSEGVHVPGPATITDSTISDNSTAGGVWAWSVDISGSTIERNKSWRSGGGVETGGGTIRDSVIADNKHTTQVTLAAGGIDADGSLTIERSRVTGNTAFDVGGVRADELLVTDSEISGNASTNTISPQTDDSGVGGVEARLLTMRGTTVAHNRAPLGPGGVHLFGTSTIERSKIAGNSGEAGGFAVKILPRSDHRTTPIAVAIRQTTIVGNRLQTTSQNGPPIAVVAHPIAAVSFTASVLAENQSPELQCSNYPNQQITGAASFFGDASCPVSPLANIVNGGDPWLSTLGDHGGPTPTMAPLAGSPVIDRISVGPACTGTDQRGVTRPQGPACDVGAVESSSALFAEGSAYTPLPPVRVLDTRKGTGGLAPLGSTPESLVVAGTHGVPADATAVVLNVTGTDVLEPTFVTAFPGGGGAVPQASNVNLGAFQTAANLVTVKLGGGGAVSFANAHGTISLVADLMGYYAPAPEGTSTFTAIAPERLGDSRDHTVLDGFGPHQVQSLVVAGGSTPVPADASAVAVNLTATDVTGSSFVTAYPKSGSTPNVSNLNVAPLDTRANLAIVKVGADRSISLYNDQGTVNLVVDVVGYFTSDDAHAELVGLPPTRLIDTRASGHIGTLHPFGPDESQAFTVTGGAVPADATAVVINLTVTDSLSGTFVTAYPTPVPADLDPPEASSVNVGPFQTNPNLVIVKVGANGMVSIYNRLGGANVIVDLVGYYR
ncbi:MAG: choice-of-anchor Q domain-containing protein, partial [Acidimicrobiales bacterium]